MGFYGGSSTGGTGQAVLTLSSQTASFNAAANYLYQVSASTGQVTVTLPTPAATQSILVKKTDSSVNNVNLTGTINGTSSATLSLTKQNQSKRLYADGSNGWIVIEGDIDLASISGITAIGTNAQTASYTLVLSDAGLVVDMNVSSLNTVTIPKNSNVNFPIGTFIDIYQSGAGSTNILAASGVTLRAPNGTMVKSQYGTVRIRQRATDEWVVSGSTIPYVDVTTISNLQYRIRASTIGVSTDGSSVGSAPSEVGSITLSQSTASQQPIWRASGSGNKPYLTFDGVDDFLQTSSGVVNATQSTTLTLVMNVKDTAVQQQLLFLSGIEVLINYNNSSAGLLGAYAQNGSNFSSASNGLHIFTVVFDNSGPLVTFYVDGSPYGSSNSLGSAAVGGQLSLFAHPSSIRFTKGDFYELLIHGQALARTDVVTLYNYFRSAYVLAGN